MVNYQTIPRINSPMRHSNQKANATTLAVWGDFPYKKINVQKPFACSMFNFMVQIQQVACGDNHILFSSENELYGIGSNSYGQLGFVDTFQVRESPRRIPLQLESNVIQVSCGKDFSVVLTEEGDVYSCGQGAYGAVGNDGSAKNTHTFQKILQGIQSISCGNRHCLALNNFGMVYGWGDNQQGQLGSVSMGKVRSKPKLLNIRNVVSISANRNISLFMKDDGVYGCGGNDLGQLGLGHKNITLEIQRIRMPSDYIVRVEAGNYSVAYSSRNEQYLFGSGAFGELLLPVKIQFPNVKSLHMGQTYGFYKDIYGQTFGWGSNLHGQLGSSHPARVFTQTLLPHLNHFDPWVCGKNYVIGHCLLRQPVQVESPIVVTQPKHLPTTGTQRQNQSPTSQITRLRAEVVRLQGLLGGQCPQYNPVIQELKFLRHENIKLKEELYLLKQFTEPFETSAVKCKSGEDWQRLAQENIALKQMVRQLTESSSYLDNQSKLLRDYMDESTQQQRLITRQQSTITSCNRKYGDLLDGVETNEFIKTMFNATQSLPETEGPKQQKTLQTSQILHHTRNIRHLMEEIRTQAGSHDWF